MTTSIPNINSLLEDVRFDAAGLVGAIVQDARTGEVLMFAWMNRESLEYTLVHKTACYWSRSRQELWIKGKTSGHFQHVKSVRLDCDGDALLLQVDQQGGACHTGNRSCFYRIADEERWCESGTQVFSAEEIYGKVV